VAPHDCDCYGDAVGANLVWCASLSWLCRNALWTSSRLAEACSVHIRRHRKLFVFCFFKKRPFSRSWFFGYCLAAFAFRMVYYTMAVSVGVPRFGICVGRLLSCDSLAVFVLGWV